MKTIFQSGVLAAAAVVLSAGLAVPVFARDLTVVSWGGNYQDAQRNIYFKPFSEKSGKPVLDEAWDGGIGVIQSKVKAGVPNWDAVQVEAEELALGCADGLYEKIDWDKMGGKDKFLDSAVNDCGVGAIVWSTAIAYDGDKLKEGPTSWADFWNVEKFPASARCARAQNTRWNSLYSPMVSPRMRSMTFSVQRRGSPAPSRNSTN